MQFGNFSVPDHNHVVNHAVRHYDATRAAIDALPSYQREWGKASILAHDDGYVTFLARATGSPLAAVRQALHESVDDDRFRKAMQAGLDTLSEMADAGDLRFHSLSPYVLVRLLRPRLVIETGVASGKSSAFILLALEHNGDGRLLSIDLPNYTADVLPDGARTHTGGRPVGWLVPDYLRHRWDLRLGDARQLLPKAVAEAPPDLFLHDSLHTREHVAFELAQVLGTDCPVIAVDDIDTGAGLALEAALHQHAATAHAYREWAVWQRGE